MPLSTEEILASLEKAEWRPTSVRVRYSDPDRARTGQSIIMSYADAENVANTMRADHPRWTVWLEEADEEA